MALDGTPPAEAPSGDPPPAQWFDSFPDDLKTHDSIKAFKGPDELAKAYLDTMGKVPVVPDKYEYQFPKDFDQKAIESFSETARKIGLTQDQYAALAKSELDTIQSASEAFNAEKKGAIDALRAEWKGETDARIGKAEAVAKALFGDRLTSRKWT